MGRRDVAERDALSRIRELVNRTGRGDAPGVPIDDRERLAAGIVLAALARDPRLELDAETLRFLASYLRRAGIAVDGDASGLARRLNAHFEKRAPRHDLVTELRGLLSEELARPNTAKRTRAEAFVGADDGIARSARTKREAAPEGSVRGVHKLRAKTGKSKAKKKGGK